MTLGDVFADAVKRDLAGLREGDLVYTEFVKDGMFEIRLSSLKDRDSFVECSVADENSEQEKNYLRLYFLSMVFNAAIYAMKKKANDKKKNKR